MTATIVRGTAGLLAAIAAMCCVVTSVAAAQQEQPIAAVLKLREVDFFYRSTRALYPCYRLRNTVANVLLAVGARDDIKVNVTGCEDVTFDDDDAFGRFDDPFDTRSDRFGNRRTGGREQSAHVRVRLMIPVAVTPEVLAEIDRDKSRRELVSRVTGNKDFANNDPIIFPALRQTVTLSRKLLKLEPKDCELLDQMTTSVFRELDIKVVRRGTCDSSTTSRIAPQMTVEALLAAQIDQKIPGAAQLEEKGGSTVGPGTAAPAPETTPAPAQGEAPEAPSEESQ